MNSCKLVMATLLSIFAHFRKATCSFGRQKRHHQALAGGTSTSQLVMDVDEPKTPPGFSRWYFNFTATDFTSLISTPPKLKYHRLKPGGVQANFSLLDPYNHRIRSHQMFDSRFFESRFAHPLRTILPCVVKTAKRLDQNVQTHQ